MPETEKIPYRKTRIKAKEKRMREGGREQLTEKRTSGVEETLSGGERGDCCKLYAGAVKCTGGGGGGG